MKRHLALISAALGVFAVAVPAHAATPVQDGRIVFWEFTSRQIYSVAPDGSALRKLTNVPDPQVAANPSWDRHGTRIAYQIFVTDGSQEDRLWIMKADGTGKRRVFDDPGFFDSAPRFTPDGTRLVFARCAVAVEECGIASVRTDGTGLTMLTPLVEDVFNVDPAVSKTGRLAFTRFNANGITAQIFVLDAGHAPVAVTPDSFGAIQPDWSPDGSRIVVGTCCTLSRDLYTIAPNGTHLKRLTYTAYPKSRRWATYAPSGTRIVYVGEKPDPDPFVTSDLFVMSADGTHQVRLKTGLTNPVGPDWAPRS